MKDRGERRRLAKKVIKKRLKVIKNASSAPSKMLEQPHRMAKKHPFDCGNPKCPMCHMDKVLKKPKISDLRKTTGLENEFIDLDDVDL